MGSDRLLVRELWRYPVKSMVGERVRSVAVGERGLHADRLWAVREVERGATTTARRLPALLQCSARYAEDPPAGAGPGKPAEAVITFPGGEELSTADPRANDRLTDLVERRVELRPLPPETRQGRLPRAPPDQERDPPPVRPGRRRGAPGLLDVPGPQAGPAGPQRHPGGHVRGCLPAAPGLGWQSGRHARAGADRGLRRAPFRPNVVVEGSGEFEWCGGRLSGPGAELEPEIPTVRCSVPVREQPGLTAQPDVMRTIKDHSDRCLGVYANVPRAGTLTEGDELIYAGRTERGAAPRAWVARHAGRGADVPEADAALTAAHAQRHRAAARQGCGAAQRGHLDRDAPALGPRKRHAGQAPAPGATACAGPASYARARRAPWPSRRPVAAAAAVRAGPTGPGRGCRADHAQLAATVGAGEAGAAGHAAASHAQRAAAHLGAPAGPGADLQHVASGATGPPGGPTAPDLRPCGHPQPAPRRPQDAVRGARAPRRRRSRPARPSPCAPPGSGSPAPSRTTAGRSAGTPAPIRLGAPGPSAAPAPARMRPRR